MRFPFRLAAFLFLLFVPPLSSWSQEEPYISRKRIDFSILLAPPPADGSPRQQAEMAELLRLQATRTPQQVAFAQADAKRSVFRFADVLGQDFSAEKFPRAEAFFEKVQRNTDVLLDSAKNHWTRARPFAANPDLRPCVHTPRGSSYPSGHATFATATAIILAAMVPEKREQIFARAEDYRQNRMIGGVHYKSDIEAGRICGTVIAAFMFQNPAFQEDFAEVKAHLRSVLNVR